MFRRRVVALLLTLALTLSPAAACALSAPPAGSALYAVRSAGFAETASASEPSEPAVSSDGSEPAGPPETSCSSYAVLVEETGQLLIEKNGSRRAYPASTTKIMTMALTLESGIGLETELTTSADAVADIYADSTQLYLAIGETMTVRDLLYGAEVRSANDGANVLAEGVSGSLEAFADLMNEKAASLGLTDTHFVNAHGLPDDDHYTTAEDLARITRWALSVSGFREIFSTYTYTTSATNAADPRPMTTTCDILNPARAGYYPDATGAKLGWTVASQYTLSTAASRNGMNLVCVVMGDATDTALYADTAALLDYCFENFRPAELTPVLAETTIPVFGDTGRTGDITVRSQPFTVYLHRSLSADDVLTLTSLPESYDAAGEIDPSVTFVLKNASGLQCAALGSFAFEYTENPLDGYDSVKATVLNVSEQRKPLAELLRELLWIVVPAGTLLIALLVSLFVQLFGRKTERLHYGRSCRSKYE